MILEGLATGLKNRTCSTGCGAASSASRSIRCRSRSRCAISWSPNGTGYRSGGSASRMPDTSCTLWPRTGPILSSSKRQSFMDGGPQGLHLSPTGRGRIAHLRDPGEGGAGSRNIQCAVDHFQHSVKIFINIDVRDPHDVEAERFKYRCPLCVVDSCRFGIMRHSIDFNNQFAIDRNKIDNKPVDRMLPAELPMRQPAISQRLPQTCFGTRLGVSQLQGSRFEPRQLIRHHDCPCQLLRRPQRSPSAPHPPSRCARRRPLPCGERCQTTCPARNIPCGVRCNDSNPVAVTRTSSPNCTPALRSRVMTLGCTTRHMFSASGKVGICPAGRLLEPMIGGKYPP